MPPEDPDVAVSLRSPPVDTVVVAAPVVLPVEPPIEPPVEFPADPVPVPVVAEPDELPSDPGPHATTPAASKTGATADPRPRRRYDGANTPIA